MRFPAWLAGLVLLLNPVANANPVQTGHTTAELVSEMQLIEPGAPFWVGLRLTPQEGWHTYWRNPGDSGLPTTISWSLPEGFTAGDIVWPAPGPVPYGPLMNFGYAGEAILLARITPPENLRAGTSVSISAFAEWLVCEDICIPEDAKLDVLMIVADGAEADAEASAFFDKARAALPREVSGPASYKIDQGQLVLRLSGVGNDIAPTSSVRFFPHQEQLIDNVAEQTSLISEGDLLVFVAQSGGTPEEIVAGVLRVEDSSLAGPRSYSIAASAADFTVPERAMESTAATKLSLWPAIFFAFLGGLLLNLMPCVFPILSLKALALVSAANETQAHKRAEGLAYSFGVVLSFLVVAVVLIGLRSGGALIGWGFQLQSPIFISVMALILMAVGLSLSGFLVIGGGIMGMGQGLTVKRGHVGAFFTGVLATVVATPCTAPFMAPAIGFALTQSTAEALGVFASLGVGMAVPFLLISFVPGFARVLPRPGAWMDAFKQFLAFPIYATMIWLVWVLGRQTGIDGAGALLMALLLIPFIVWLWPRTRSAAAVGKVLASALVLASCVSIVALVRFSDAQYGGQDGAASAGLAWETYSDAKLAEYRAADSPVFVNFTAAWCVTCLANEQVALNTEAVRGLFTDRGVKYLKADWTRRDAKITAALSRFGRSGVPLYLYYPAGSGSPPKILPQILTPGAVLDAVEGRSDNES